MTTIATGPSSTGPSSTDPRRPLRLLLAPSTEPPYDDEPGAELVAVDGSLALSFPASVPAIPLRLVPPALDVGDIPGARTPRGALPAPRQVCKWLMQAMVEVMAGDRPAAQLAGYATLDVLDQLERAIRRWPRVRPAAPSGGSAQRTPVGRPVVVAVHVGEPTGGVAEACGAVACDGRRWALAFRIEGRGGRWQCTALQLG